MIKATSKIIKRVWIFIIFFMLLLLLFFATLFHGVEIKKLSLPNIKASGLYIKLDKKLIVLAKNIHISPKKSSQESSKEEIRELLAKFPWINRLFKTIHIENLKIYDNNIKILYKDDIFYINSKYLTLDTKLSTADDTLKATISSLIFKDFNLSLAGVATGDINSKELTFKGKFKTFNISGDLLLHVKKNLLKYYANSENFSTLRPFMEALGKKVEIEEEAKNWIYKQITAKNYKLNSLEGQINLKNGNFYPKKMKGSAKVTNAKIKFHKNVPEVLAKTININLKNNTLFFHIPKGSYENIELKDQKAYIYNLLTKGNGIVLNINAQTLLNDPIQKILKAYKLNVPLLQKSGQTKANINMDIGFVPYDIDVNGTFEVTNSDILISNAPFYTKQGLIKLNNRYLHIKDTNLQYKELFDINTSGLLDLYQEKYDGNLSINSLHVKSDTTSFLHVKDKTMPIKIDIKKDDLAIFLPKLEANLNFKNNTNTIKQNNLSLIKEYSPFMQDLNIYDGKFSLKTQDFSTFSLQTHISSMKPFLSHDKKPLTSLDILVDIGEKELNAYSKNHLLTINNKDNKTKIAIKNANLLLDLNNSNTSEQSTTTTTLKGTNSNLFITDMNKTILLESYTFTKKGVLIKGEATYKQGTLALEHTPKSLHVNLKALNDTFVNTLIQKEIFTDGNFSLKLNGLNSKNLSGHINFKNTHLKSFASYNNILAFINSIPALLTFKQPGFNEKGYQARNGDILFSRKGDIITLHTIDIDGVDADIGGSGTIDLKNEKLNLDLKLKTFKDISKAVKNIPLLNYIFLGDDKSIETAIEVKGDISDPKVTTKAIEDVVFSPFNIIKRTIKLPFKLLE